jgi:hypothetical protein
MPRWVYRGHVPEDALDMSMPLPRRKRAETSGIFPPLTRAKRITTATPRRTSLSIIPTFCTKVLSFFSIENLQDHLTIFSPERAMPVKKEKKGAPSDPSPGINVSKVLNQ